MSVAGPVPMSGVPLGSAAGLLSMLEEEQTQLQVAALTNLNKVIDTHWAEVASSISVIEAMYEDEFFAQRELAALLASKVRRAPDARDLPPDGAFPRGLAVCPQKQDLRSVPLDTSAQVFYHLGELDDALNYALCAGSLFDVNETTDFVQTMLSTSPREKTLTLTSPRDESVFRPLFAAEPPPQPKRSTSTSSDATLPRKAPIRSTRA
jgi:26S proteasome regulatory subunit N2